MVLAIGIVVDDAIVVLENVERLMARAASCRRGRRRSRRCARCTGAIIAIVLVLCAVFIPVAFLGGIAGQLYQQFAVTVAIAVVHLGHRRADADAGAVRAAAQAGSTRSRVLFRPFNRGFAWLTRAYLGGVDLALRHRSSWSLLRVRRRDRRLRRCCSCACPGQLRAVRGSGLHLRRDHPARRRDARAHRRRSARKLQQMVAEQPGGRAHLRRQRLRPDRRRQQDQRGDDLRPAEALGRAHADAPQDWRGDVCGKGAALADGIVLAFNPPPIRGLGTAGGFEVYVQDRADADPKQLAQVAAATSSRALRKRPGAARASTPSSGRRCRSCCVEVDREKAMALGVPVSDVFDALQSTMGSLYVNDFNKFGRTYRVQMQADARVSRSQPEDLGNVYVRSAGGEMMPLKSADHASSSVVGPEQIERYNGFLAAKVLGSAAARRQLGRGDRRGRGGRAPRRCPPATRSRGPARPSRKSAPAARRSSRSRFAHGHGLPDPRRRIYERWSLPVAVLLAVPFALLGALLAVLLRGMEQRHLLPDRPGRADRPGGEERDPDRRVRDAGAWPRA